MTAPKKVWFSNTRQASTVTAWGNKAPKGCVEYVRSDYIISLIKAGDKMATNSELGHLSSDAVTDWDEARRKLEQD
jgi:hypothetical protein